MHDARHSEAPKVFAMKLASLDTPGRPLADLSGANLPMGSKASSPAADGALRAHEVDISAEDVRVFMRVRTAAAKRKGGVAESHACPQCGKHGRWQAASLPLGPGELGAGSIAGRVAATPASATALAPRRSSAGERSPQHFVGVVFLGGGRPAIDVSLRLADRVTAFVRPASWHVLLSDFWWSTIARDGVLRQPTVAMAVGPISRSFHSKGGGILLGLIRQSAVHYR